MKEVRRRTYIAKNVAELKVDLEFNVREDYGDIELLKTQIKENGVVNPIRVRKEGDDHIIVDGHRRFIALEELSKEGFDFEIPVEVIKGTEADYLKLMILANEGKPLTVTEMADAAFRLSKEGVKRKEIAQIFGRSQATISNWIKFFDLPESTQTRIRSGESSIEIEVNAARESKKNKEQNTESVRKKIEEEDGDNRFEEGHEVKFNASSYLRAKMKDGYVPSRNKEVWEVLELVFTNQLKEEELENLFGPKQKV